MAHEILKPEKWASAALGLLENERVLAGLVGRDSGADFVGAEGDAVNIKRPAILSGTREALRDMDGDDYAGIKSEALRERSIQVRLTDHVYSAVDLSDAELSLDITNFGAQVLNPQSKAIADRIEFMLAAKLNGLTAEAKTVTGPEGVRAEIVALRKVLNKRNVPATGRILVVGVDVEELILNDPQFVRVDQSGSDAALRAAEIGRVAGFRVVVSTVLQDNRMVAFHPSAYTLVTRAPSVPEGAVKGESTAFGGVAMRAIKDYNSQTAKDRSFLSTFAGVGETTDFEITYAADGSKTVSETPTMLRAAAVTISVAEPSDPPE